MPTIYDIYGNILFHQDDNLSLKELVEKNKKNLRGADLRNCNLRGANLSYAYLRGADLRNCNLRDADLRNCNLRSADLSDADLSDADLRGAIIPIFSKWNISYMLNSKDFETSDISKIIIKIGCKEKNIKDWDNWFNSDEEFETKRGTQQFKQIYANYVAVREYLKIIVKGEN